MGEPKEMLDWMFASRSDNAYRARERGVSLANRAAPFALDRPVSTKEPGRPRPINVEPEPPRPITPEDKIAAQNEVRELFSNWADINHDGFLDLQELGLLMEKLGMDSANAARLMKGADKNSDKLVTVTEFMAWLSSGTKAATGALRVAVDRCTPKSN